MQKLHAMIVASNAQIATDCLEHSAAENLALFKLRGTVKVAVLAVPQLASAGSSDCI